MHLSIFLLSVPLVGAWWVGLEELTFEEARAACYPGDLATFSTNQELRDLLKTNQELRQALANQSTAYFWVGLEKPKDLCVVKSQPLRGFRFVDRRQDLELITWREEPTDTCTNVRCGALAVDSGGSWGLVSQSCKNKNHFICGPSGSTEPRPDRTRPEPGSTEPDPGSEGPKPDRTRPEGPDGTREPEPNEEQTRVSPSFRPEPGLEESPTPVSDSEPPPPSLSPVPTPAGAPDPTPAGAPDPTPPGAPDPTPPGAPDPTPAGAPDPTPAGAPDPTPAGALLPPSGSTAGPGGPGPGSGPGPLSRSSCQSLPKVPNSRFLFLDDTKPDLVSVKCWSGENLLLRCVNGVWTWTGPDLSPGLEQVTWSVVLPDFWSTAESLTSVSPPPDPGPDPVLSEEVRCSGCGPGLQWRDGECEDVDECLLSPAPCAHGCVNAHGSFTCTPAPLGAALVHALIAVAAVTLAVVVAVTIWCCIRRKRRRDEKQDQDQDQNQTEA